MRGKRGAAPGGGRLVNCKFKATRGLMIRWAHLSHHHRLLGGLGSGGNRQGSSGDGGNSSSLQEQGMRVIRRGLGRRRRRCAHRAAQSPLYGA